MQGDRCGRQSTTRLPRRRVPRPHDLADRAGTPEPHPSRRRAVRPAPRPRSPSHRASRRLRREGCCLHAGNHHTPTPARLLPMPARPAHDSAGPRQQRLDRRIAQRHPDGDLVDTKSSRAPAPGSTTRTIRRPQHRGCRRSNSQRSPPLRQRP